MQLPTAGPESRLRPVQAQMSTLRDSDTPRPMGRPRTAKAIPRGFRKLRNI